MEGLNANLRVAELIVIGMVVFVAVVVAEMWLEQQRRFVAAGATLALPTSPQIIVAGFAGGKEG